METLVIIFWISVFIVFYTYIGYGVLLYALVWIKETLCGGRKTALATPDQWPDVTLLIAAYNEQDVVQIKMENSLALDYPPQNLKIVWVTDGSTDNTNQLLAQYPLVETLYSAPRMGKSAAVSRAMGLITTPIVVMTDANTMICPQAIKIMVTHFTDPKVGCVAGEKRIAQLEQQDATAGEGIYWRYESILKALDYRLHTAVGAAGELFAIRTELYTPIAHNMLLDDFMLSMQIAKKGYKIAYCKDAYATESASQGIDQEAKRKVRISAGALQSIYHLRSLLNVFKYGTLSFQYISHRVLRWSITPILYFALLPINFILAFNYGPCSVYGILLILQIILYALGICGCVLKNKELKSRIIFIPYYFLFMNVCVLQGARYLSKHTGSGVWEKAKRQNG